MCVFQGQSLACKDPEHCETSAAVSVRTLRDLVRLSPTAAAMSSVSNNIGLRAYTWGSRVSLTWGSSVTRTFNSGRTGGHTARETLHWALDSWRCMVGMGL